MWPEDHLTLSYLRPVFSVPCMKKPDAKGLYWSFKCQFTVSIVLVLLKYQCLGATLYMFFNEYYVSYCVKTRIHWGKRQSLVNHMFLLVLMLLALLNNQLYFVILSPTDFAFLKSCCSCGFASEWLQRAWKMVIIF